MNNESFLKYDKYLTKLIGEESKNNLYEELGGTDKVSNASFGMSKDSGCAYDGALIDLSLKIAEYGIKINEILPQELQVEKSSIYKVALLQHIAKVTMYKPNDNLWEVEKRGILYSFNNQGGVSLKCGELSALLVLNCGIKLSEEEFEAIRIIDKTKEENYNNGKYYYCALSNIIRQANELVTIEYRNKK